MLAIRLRRNGAKKDAHYRVVVTERSAGRDGRFLEILGHYHPRRNPMEVTLDVERVDTWVGKGAQMSPTVTTLYKLTKAGNVPAEEVAPAPKAAPAAVVEEELETAAESEASEAGATASDGDEGSAADADGEEE